VAKAREERALSAKKRPDKQRVTGEAARKKRREEAKKLSLNQRLIKALAHPLRVKLLAFLNEGEWSPNELSEELGEGLSQVSYHINVLVDFEMIEMTKTEPRRGAVEHYYRAIERAYIPSEMAKRIPKSGQQVIANDILEAIDKDVGDSAKSGRFYERNDCHVSYTPASLDEEGCAEANELADEFVSRFLEIEGKSAGRRATVEGGGEHIAISAAVLVFPSEHGEKKKARAKKKGKRSKKPKGK
jgi:DNA-binding transcriptional ArsR family regulator